MKKGLRVLSIKDSDADMHLWRRHLSEAGYEAAFKWIDRPESLHIALSPAEWDLILCDGTPEFNALDALSILKENGADVPFIVISGIRGEELAVETVLAGAQGYLMKDRLEKLPAMVERALRETAIRRARKAAGQEREWLNSFMANVPAVIWEDWDHPSPEGRGRSNFVSDYVEKLLGYTVCEWLSTLNFRLSIVHPDDRERAQSETESFISSGEGGRQQFRWLAKDGKALWVESYCSVIHDDEGRPSGLRGITVDISERIQSEEQLRRSHKMEAMSWLAGGMAVNNLLTVINGRCDFAFSSLKTDDPLRPEIEEIRKAGARAVVLTQQLLACNRKQREPRILAVNSIISDLEGVLERLVGADIECRLMLGPDTGKVQADREHIEQAVANLALNARDAMPGGGRLTIATSNVDLSEEYTRHHVEARPGPHVMVSMTDNGDGMDMATLAHIFDPFFTTNKLPKSTGPGLAMVREIVKESGGTIAVKSQLGRGTTVTIYLPQVVAVMDKPLAETAGAAVATETILITEDDDVVRPLAASVLKVYGYQVLEASNGAEALSICDRHEGPISLLISDFAMPDMNGCDLARRAARLRPAMGVLIISGYERADIMSGTSITEHGFCKSLSRPPI